MPTIEVASDDGGDPVFVDDGGNDDDDTHSPNNDDDTHPPNNDERRQGSDDERVNDDSEMQQDFEFVSHGEQVQDEEEQEEEEVVEEEVEEEVVEEEEEEQQEPPSKVRNVTRGKEAKSKKKLAKESKKKLAKNRGAQDIPRKRNKGAQGGDVHAHTERVQQAKPSSTKVDSSKAFSEVMKRKAKKNREGHQSLLDKVTEGRDEPETHQERQSSRKSPRKTNLHHAL